MLVVAGFCPGVESMITCFLYAGLAVLGCDLITGVGLVSAFGTCFEFLMRMIGFHFCFVIMVAATAGTGAGVVRSAEVEITDFALADHDAGTIITRSTGITL